MTTTLDEMPNAFDEVNHVWCFNHTLQLSAKSLIRPFNTGLSSGKTGDADNMESDGEGENNGMWEGDDSEEGIDSEEEGPDNHIEDDADILADLDPDEHAALMEDTAAVCAVITTVHLTPLHNAFMMSIGTSSPILLPILRYDASLTCQLHS
jgi:hypothetical protein